MRVVGLDAAELDAMLRLNRLRGEAAGGDERAALEAHFAQHQGADRRLAVYGTLAPGEPNHHHLSAVPGVWRAGTVNGRLEQVGWGADMGYPALVWSPDGEPVAVQAFASEELPAHWPRLDEFEGAQYLRILVPVRFDDGAVAVANLYAAHPAPPG
ncbi:gamma-glutamylcyclotransferase family protein [Lysobacter enzymogenes]|uniref:gamma-glutamylcyclotransferase family protein n=1 Tax=Lysobacter enzymogenes TaxID=69 RepID=UPI001A961973|nr:gamma-glutamylcyclotransferase family protein [Lysobacter enzymogenes]QQP97126.1 gamma-glutamylcyclotransferase [Lysobacter enzymogenes]